MKSEEAVKKVWDDPFFVLFMKLRFPKELDEGYIREWKSRFMTGNPLPYMDFFTVKCYLQAVLESCLKILVREEA